MHVPGLAGFSRPLIRILSNIAHFFPPSTCSSTPRIPRLAIMRVLSMTALVAIAGSAVAFVPQGPKPSEKINIGKALQKLALAPAVVLGIYAGPMIQPVHADGSVSATTVHRAQGIYGPRVMALKDAVAKGDFDAMKKEDGAATLYNSGAFALNRVQQKVVAKAYDDVRAAVAKKDAGALKSAWAVYFHEAGLDKPNPFRLDEPGQSYSGDFDFRKGSPLFDRYAAELAGESGK